MGLARNRHCSSSRMLAVAHGVAQRHNRPLLHPRAGQGLCRKIVSRQPHCSQPRAARCQPSHRRPRPAVLRRRCTHLTPFRSCLRQGGSQAPHALATAPAGRQQHHWAAPAGRQQAAPAGRQQHHWAAPAAQRLLAPARQRAVRERVTTPPRSPAAERVAQQAGFSGLR